MGYTMTADEFLRQIERYDRLIDCKLSELFRYKNLVTSVTVPTDREAVQTSGVSDKVGNTVAKIIDLKNEIDTIIDEYIDTRKRCINVIEMLRDQPIQYTIIHKHYVQYKTYAEIAAEENYSYDGIIKAKNRALARVDVILRKNNRKNRNCL